jgi:hypothetical protein
MSSARKAIAAILVALMFGVGAPSVRASAANSPSPTQSGTIGTPRILSSAEFATEPSITRHAAKRVERHGPESVALPTRIDAAIHGARGGRVIAPCPASESAANASSRGRAPPLSPLRDHLISIC